MTTLPNRLRSLGYATHLIGKWHLGQARKEALPLNQGFDDFFGYYNGFIGYDNYLVPNTELMIVNILFLFPISPFFFFLITILQGLDIHNGSEPTMSVPKQHATKVFTQKAIDVINRSSPNKPFYLQLAHLAGHTGWDTTELKPENETECLQRFSYITDLHRRRYECNFIVINI